MKSWRGDDLGVALIGRDILGSALGFNPSKVAEMHDGQGEIKGRESQLMGRHEEIVNMCVWVAAYLVRPAIDSVRIEGEECLSPISQNGF